MTATQLIQLLSNCDENAEIVIENTDPNSINTFESLNGLTYDLIENVIHVYINKPDYSE